MKKMEFDVAVIGGGPAGMIAAGRAANLGRSVCLVEKNKVLGRKLLISGAGRCNITNSAPVGRFLENFSNNGRFLRNAFARFFSNDLVELFRGLGVATKEERGGRVFPVSDRAKDILDALILFMKNNKVSIKSGANVLGIKRLSNGFLVKTVIGDYFAKRIVLATGGKSYPKTGSTGDGYKFAKRLGHKIVPLRPALVGIHTKSDFVKLCQGISLKNVICSVIVNGKKRLSKFGEMLFTHFGLSGPIIMDMSADVYDFLKSGNNLVELSINFKPALEKSQLDKRLLREFALAPNRALRNIFKNLLPKRIAFSVLEYSGVDGNIKANSVTKADRNALLRGLFDFRMEVIKTRPIEEAIVTRGGVDTRGIDPKTMQSRIVKGLFFAGEIIDIDAKTGGYNLQAAFSTGWVAGSNV